VRPSLPFLLTRFSICASLLISPACVHAQTLTSQTYGGSGSDAANGVATDSAGNIYVVGTTTSFDLPLLNPAQSTNSGTQLLFSTDAGSTWKPLGNLPMPYMQYQYSQALPIAVDPTNAAVFYAGFNGMLYKTTDSGRHFSSILLPQPATITIDPANPSTLYANTGEALPGALFKSTDGGASWITAMTIGIPASVSIQSLVIDPFHPESLWIIAGGDAYVSIDGANSWSSVSLPAPVINGAFGLIEFVFDAVTPGTLYVTGSGSSGLYLLKSTDGGQKWTPGSAPFQGGTLVADPVRAGYLYDLSPGANGGGPGLFYRSADGGVTWQSFPFPANYASSLAIDPANSNIILAGSYRSNDGGESWSPTVVSRDIQIAFAPTGKGLVYASGPITSDVFLAKFKPDGKTLEFATYFGGMGNESASGIQLDASGNIWVAGSTNSFDLPGSTHALLKQLKGITNIFLAKFSPEGQLLASTYLGGSAIDTIAALRLDASGDPWIFGQTDSVDFPFTNGTQGLPASLYSVFLAKLASSADQLLFSAPVPGVNQASGMTIDSAGNILLTGYTVSSDFPVTAGVVHGLLPPGQSSAQAFVIKLDRSGNTIFSTYLGGSMGADGSGLIIQSGGELDNYGVAVATDETGIYITGNTSATDFPTTPGAYQTKLKDGCTYPAFAYDTGLIGTIYSFLVDDVFVTKLSPDAKTILYSTLLGGSCYDRPTDIAVTPAGAVFVTGETNSIDFPLVHPQEAAPAIQNYESFVSMISPNGASLAYSSYLLAGSAPTLALGPNGILNIAGSAGFDAQSMTYSGFPLAPPNPDTKASLTALNVAGAPAGLNLAGAVNDFSLLPGPVAPGEIIALTVPDFKPAQDINVGINELLPLGTALGGTQVLFDGKPAQVISIARGKIVCIAPRVFTNNASTTIQVNSNGTLSNPLQAEVAATALGLLSADGSGTGLANARNQDGTLNSPTNPAKRGTTATVYFTGAGVPPATIIIEDNFSDMVRIAPLKGFVPGIYAAYFMVPTSLSDTSPLSVTLSAVGSNSQTLSNSQSLTIYIE
jgi:uncharacterized protein (TIGR03437 family)